MTRRMNAEERAAYDREQRRCWAERNRLLMLSGNAAAAQEVDAWYDPLRSFVPPSPSCHLPYEAPELLP